LVKIYNCLVKIIIASTFKLWAEDFFSKNKFFYLLKVQESVIFVFLNKKNILSRKKCRKCQLLFCFYIFSPPEICEKMFIFWGRRGRYFSPPDIRENSIPYRYTLYLHYSLPNSDCAPLVTQYSQSQLPLLLPAPTHNSLPHSHSPSPNSNHQSEFSLDFSIYKVKQCIKFCP
jgi:hypothetical protein